MKNRNARGGSRTRKPFGIRPSNVRVCQFHHPSAEKGIFRGRPRLASVECILLAHASALTRNPNRNRTTGFKVFRAGA